MGSVVFNWRLIEVDRPSATVCPVLMLLLLLSQTARAVTGIDILVGGLRAQLDESGI